MSVFGLLGFYKLGYPMKLVSSNPLFSDNRDTTKPVDIQKQGIFGS
jgi:hypothetical protein